MKFFLIISVFFFNVLSAFELEMLYNKNLVLPVSPREIELVEHAKSSFENCMREQSKLNGTNFIEDTDVKIWATVVPSDHLLNNLCTLSKASHLHIGLLKGGSFIAALYGNQDTLKAQIGLDWFQEVSEEVLYSNCNKFLDSSKYQIVNCDCFHIDKSIFTCPIDIYFYDADHSMKAHEKAFTYYNDVFADVFIAVIDDWGCPWIRRPTFKAFEKLGYYLLYETIIPATEEYGNGQYLAVIRKSEFSK